MGTELVARPLVRDGMGDGTRVLAVRASGWLALPAGLMVLVGVWALASARLAKPYLLPSPAAVVGSWWLHRERILWHTGATAAEIVFGFAVGFLVAAILGYVIYRSPTLDRFLTPYVVASQAVPIVAVAPLLIFWFRAGTPVKVATAALIVFFPMLVTTVVGLRNIPTAYHELMHVLSASRWQTLTALEVPAALPYLLGGVRVGVTLAVIGAVVGEFLGADRGLGHLVQVSKGMYADPLLFASLLTLVGLALSLYGAAAVLERTLLRRR